MSTNTNRTALVTGGCGPAGHVIARGLATRGWTVAVHHDGRIEEAAALVREIRDGGGRAAAFAADLAREDEARALLPAVAAELGPPVLLVNNGAAGAADGIGDAGRDAWDLNMETGLRAPVVLTDAFARHLPEGRDGNVINVIERQGAVPAPDFLSSTLATSGLQALTRTLALALAPRIRVNGVGLGPASDGDPPPDLERDLPAAIGFILETPSLTGQVVTLGGGRR